jgi:rubredoxin
MSTQNPGPINPLAFEDEDDKIVAGTSMTKKAFDCPECTANNPYDDGFTVGDEIRCFYCGAEFDVLEGDGKLKFRAK